MQQKKDKSRKGSIDERIKPLVELINSSKNYYTTSSCSGRIILIELPKSNKKHDCRWLYATHEKAMFKNVKNALKQIKNLPVWFRQQSFILHICAKTLDDAEKLIKLSIALGFKRSGIISTSKRIILEIIGTEQMSTIIADRGRVLITDSYLNSLVAEANKNMSENIKNIKKLEMSKIFHQF